MAPERCTKQWLRKPAVIIVTLMIIIFSFSMSAAANASSTGGMSQVFVSDPDVDGGHPACIIDEEGLFSWDQADELKEQMSFLKKYTPFTLMTVDGDKVAYSLIINGETVSDLYQYARVMTEITFSDQPYLIDWNMASSLIIDVTNNELLLHIGKYISDMIDEEAADHIAAEATQLLNSDGYLASVGYALHEMERYTQEYELQSQQYYVAQQDTSAYFANSLSEAAGEYILFAVAIDGKTLSINDIEKTYSGEESISDLLLQEDGRGKMSFQGESVPLFWNIMNGGIMLTLRNEGVLNGVYQNGIIKVNNGGQLMIYVRNDADISCIMTMTSMEVAAASLAEQLSYGDEIDIRDELYSSISGSDYQEAYLKLLDLEKNNIKSAKGFFQADPFNKQVAFSDLNGDGIPEMFYQRAFPTVKGSNIYNGLELLAVTFLDGNVVPFAEDPDDYTVRTASEKSIYPFFKMMYQTNDSDLLYVYYETQVNAGIKKELYGYRTGENVPDVYYCTFIDNMQFVRAEGLSAFNPETMIPVEDFESVFDETLQNIKEIDLAVLSANGQNNMLDDYLDHNFASYPCAGMNYNNAVVFLGGEPDEDFVQEQMPQIQIDNSNDTASVNSFLNESDSSIDLIVCVDSSEGEINLRNGASTSSDIVITIPNGTELEITDFVYDSADDLLFGACEYDGYSGYVSLRQTRILAGEFYPLPYYEVQAAGGQGTVSVREFPGLDSRIVAEIPDGTVLEMYDLVYDEFSDQFFGRTRSLDNTENGWVALKQTIILH